MRILMVASEVAPFAKTGGLADVLGAVPLALGRFGHQVDVVVPRYRGVTGGTRLRTLDVRMGSASSRTSFYTVPMADRVRVILVERPEYYDREFLYGPAHGDYADNAERFAFLAHAALTFAAGEERYAVVHAHDWQAGLVPVLLATTYAGDPHVGGTPSLFTIHNLAYQGIFETSWAPRIGLGPAAVRPDAMEYWGRISFLKGGIRFARIITTVSPRYAEEIQTAALGFGFDGILRDRAADLIGILNGIDYDHWDPERDVHLPEPFNASNLAGKEAAKRRMREEFGLAATPEALEAPVFGTVSRLVDQKGFDLVAGLEDALPAYGADFVLLGTGDRRYEDMWRGLAARYPDRVGVRIGFDERLAHLIEGGADMFLMPSRFEPCGLNQMYSLRYGTVPVVRATGGLRDTVRNYDPRTGEGNGFTFEAYTPGALGDAVQRAVAVYKTDKDGWRRIQRAGMGENHSWDTAARAYVDAYQRAARQ